MLAVVQPEVAVEDEVAWTLNRAKEYIQIHGWTRGTECNASGEVCLLRAIDTVAESDEAFLSALQAVAYVVYRDRGNLQRDVQEAVDSVPWANDYLINSQEEACDLLDATILCIHEELKETR